jgi:hypothetical protein
MTTTQNLSTDDIVTFRSDFSAKLVGVEFIVVNADAGVDAETGKRMVSLKRKIGGRWGYRLAYLADLVNR